MLANYSSAFSDNESIQLKELPLRSYNAMAMQETQIRFGEKYIMLVDQDDKSNLGLCYSNKQMETYLRENLSEEQKEKIREPKRNYLTLYFENATRYAKNEIFDFRYELHKNTLSFRN